MNKWLLITAFCVSCFFGCNKDSKDTEVLLPYEDGNIKISVIQTFGLDYLSGIHFFNEKQGIALSTDGTILKTNDGGANWMAGFNRKNGGLSDQFLFMDSRYGFVYGTSDLWRTSDSGKTWSIALTSPTSSFRAMDYNDKGAVFACADYPDNQIYSSIDKGITWTKLTSFPFRINKVVFCDNAGFIIGDEGSVFKSADDGNTWYKVANLGAFLIDIKVINNVGFCLTEENGNYKTDDNGETWQRINVIVNGTEFVSNLIMLSPDTSIIFGNGGTSGYKHRDSYFGFSKTENRGTDWRTLVFAETHDLLSTSFYACNACYGLLGNKLIKLVFKNVGGVICQSIPKDVPTVIW